MLETAVIPTAGRGTRMMPATAVLPKVMLPLVNVPAIQLVVTEALEAGMKRLVIVLGENGDLTRRHFEIVDGPWQGRLEWVEQREPRGLGHAIACARERVGDRDFAVLLGDAVFLDGNPTRALAEDFHKHGETVLGLQRVPSELLAQRGIVRVGETKADRFSIQGVDEKPGAAAAGSDLALMGRAVFRATMLDALARAEVPETGELHWTVGINALARSETVAGLLITDHRFDIGNPASYLAAIEARGNQIPSASS